MQDTKLLGACGLYCGACYHYLAFLPGNEHLLEKYHQRGRELEKCDGCRSTANTEHCAQCTLKSCANLQGVLHCGLCPSYPCEELKKFQHDGRLHHIVVLDNIEHLKKIEPEKWLLEQSHRWQCRCGRRFSWYDENCFDCSSPLPSYGFRKFS
jgi:hypothetical protein